MQFRGVYKIFWRSKGGFARIPSNPTLPTGLVDQGEFEAMKTLSGWEAVHCDEHPFQAKIKVSV